MRNESLVKEISESRIATLFEMAEKCTEENTKESKNLSKRYVELARKISRHYKVRIPKKFRSKICKKCGNFLVPGINCNVRVVSSNKYICYKCECGNEIRIFYTGKRSKN